MAVVREVELVAWLRFYKRAPGQRDLLQKLEICFGECSKSVKTTIPHFGNPFGIAQHCPTHSDKVEFSGVESGQQFFEPVLLRGSIRPRPGQNHDDAGDPARFGRAITERVVEIRRAPQVQRIGHHDEDAGASDVAAVGGSSIVGPTRSEQPPATGWHRPPLPSSPCARLFRILCHSLGLALVTVIGLLLEEQAPPDLTSKFRLAC